MSQSTPTPATTSHSTASGDDRVRSIYFMTSVPRVVTTLALKKLWKGAVYSRWSPVCYEELPPLELPGPEGVRVQNKVCGICASDLHLVFVDIDPMVHPAALPGFEQIYLGHEVVSEVVEAGPEVETLEVGDRVLMKTRFLGPQCKSLGLPLCPQCEQGLYARCANQSAATGQKRGAGGGWGDEYTCHESEVWKSPDYLDDDQVALVEPLSCGVRAVLRRPPNPGDKVLVLGCGMIGLGTVQALRAIQPEAEVYAAARYPQQQEAARRWGAEVLPKGDLFELTAERTGGKVYVGDFKNTTMLGGWDIIYDCVGTETTVSDCLRLTRAGGAVVIVGVSLHRFGKIDLTPTWHQEVDLLGALAHGTEEWEGERVSTFELTARFIRDGKMHTDGLITHRFALEQWKEAIRTAVDKRTGCIKVVFDY